MFSKSRKRIVATVMVSLALFFLVTLGVIYGSSYHRIQQQSREMLQRYVSADFPEAPPGPGEMRPQAPPETPKPFPRGGEPAYQLSTFYSVVFSRDGEPLAIDNGGGSIYSQDQLVAIAQDILARGKSTGRMKNLLYLTQVRGDRMLVAFMDNTVTDNSIQTLLFYTLIGGGAAMAVLFFLSLFLARRIVKPLEENDRRQKQFVSDAGHELKTPVSVIGANTELLSRQLGTNEWLANIQYENERMGALVTQLLDLSRAENAQTVKERLDFSRLVLGEALPFESVAFEKGLRLESQVAEDIFLEGNQTQLRQLTAILLDNAIRHASGGKDVRLTLRQAHRSALLTVENSGPAIPPEQQARLFERFYRVDEVRNSESNSYGLGLAIAKAIADAHRGSISLACREGKVLFTVTLPTQK